MLLRITGPMSGGSCRPRFADAPATRQVIYYLRVQLRVPVRGRVVRGWTSPVWLDRETEPRTMRRPIPMNPFLFAKTEYWRLLDQRADSCLRPLTILLRGAGTPAEHRVAVQNCRASSAKKSASTWPSGEDG
jgi:hypothetical protein